MTTFINNRGIPPAPTAYYRQANYAQPQQQSAPRPTLTDDYERWYTESTPSNRMSLSIRSGIPSEVSWALDRLMRLAYNDKPDKPLFQTITGVIDGLFDWPEWYVTEGYKRVTDSSLLFSPSPENALYRRFALESLFILRNAAFHEANALELANHTHTLPLIMNALYNLDHTMDENSEALIQILDIFNLLASRYTVHPAGIPRMNPIPPLLQIAVKSMNRTLIISSLTALTGLFANPANAMYLRHDSPALAASIRYLPLFVDKALLDASLNYLYMHTSHASMARAFLLHPEMSGVLRILASLLVHEQQGVEKTTTVDVTGTIHTVPSTAPTLRDHELTTEEFDSLVAKAEPQRCFDWMKTMFVAKAEGELTQVDFWNMYKDAFAPTSEQYPLLVASDVIKNVTQVFPQAQAMVMPGLVQRFIVRGVDRRKDAAPNERFRCLWEKSQCPSEPFTALGELYDHVIEKHLSSSDTAEATCLWSTCQQKPMLKHTLTAHILTHLSSTQLTQKHPSQSDTITLPSEGYPYPNDNPTIRPIPPPRSTTITYSIPAVDPPSTSLTALLILRILFRTSFASADAAPRVDADHFGFPGLLEDTGDLEAPEDTDAGHDLEREGERRGRKAFLGIRKHLEGVRIRDEALMSWVTEIMDAGILEN